MVRAGGRLWVSVREGADEVGVTENTIYKWVRSGKLTRAPLPGRALMLDLQEIFKVDREVSRRELSEVFNPTEVKA